MANRGYSTPWTVGSIPGGYKVLDANGQSLAYVYGRETKADADIAKCLMYSTTELPRRGLLREVWCSGVGRACRLLAQRASPPIGARGQSRKNLHPDS